MHAVDLADNKPSLRHVWALFGFFVHLFELRHIGKWVKTCSACKLFQLLISRFAYEHTTTLYIDLCLVPFISE